METPRKPQEAHPRHETSSSAVEDDTPSHAQTRSAKRTAAASLSAAVDMVEEGLISRRGVRSPASTPAQLDQLLHPMIDLRDAPEPVARGLNASPGAASGGIVFDADTAVERAVRPGP